VSTGHISGLDVLDLDARNGGDSWFQANKFDLPSTQVHRTRAGGLHFFFQSAVGLRCSAGKIAAGVDVRAGGGYVIWWPAAGLPVLSESLTVPWPTWLLRRLLPPSEPRTHCRFCDDCGRHVRPDQAGRDHLACATRRPIRELVALA
jgi:hypothetical protein